MLSFPGLLGLEAEGPSRENGTIFATDITEFSAFRWSAELG
jgi:hypothetical protein